MIATRQPGFHSVVFPVLLILLCCTARSAAQEQAQDEHLPAQQLDAPEEDPFELEPTYVLAPRLAATPSEQTISTSVLTAQQIKAMSAQNVGQALSFLPGVYITRGTRRNRIRVSIRGFNPRYVRIYLDGVPINPASDETVDLSTLPVNNIETIEVIKGPAPVRFGANAMAGVILITTKTGDAWPGAEGFYAHTFYPADAFYQEVLNGSLEYVQPEHDVYNEDRYGLSVGVGNPKLNGYFFAARDDSQGYRPHSAFVNNNFSGRVVWNPVETLQLNLAGNYFLGERELLNSSTLLFRKGQYGGGGTGTGPMYGASNWDLNDWQRGQASVNAVYHPLPWLQTRATGFFFQEDYELTVQKPGDPLWTVSRSPRGSMVAGGRIEQGFFLKQGWPLAMEHEIILGFDGQQESYHWSNSANTSRGQELVENDASVVTLGFFIEDTIELWKSLWLVIGVRHDMQTGADISRDDIPNPDDSLQQATSPHFSFLYNFHDWLLVHGAVGRTYRFPRLRDRFDYVAGNPALQPESAWDYELGVNIQPLYWLVVKGSLFRNDVRDLIYSPGKFIQFQNIGRARFQGVEAEILVDPIPELALFVNYTFLDSRDLDLDAPVPYSPENKLAYGFTARYWDFQLSYQGMFVGPRETGDELTPSLPAYHVADIKLLRRFLFPNILPGIETELYVAVQNLFDTRYEEILGFPLAGRSFQLGLSCRWIWDRPQKRKENT